MEQAFADDASIGHWHFTLKENLHAAANFQLSVGVFVVGKELSWR
jgi:hypothetical protein